MSDGEREPVYLRSWGGRVDQRWIAHLLFEPRDVWIGVYWNDYYETGMHRLTLFVCLIPMLPLMIDFGVDL